MSHAPQNSGSDTIALNTYLSRITAAVKHPGQNPRLVQLLQEKFGHLNDRAYVPRDTEPEETDNQQPTTSNH